jgi:peptidylprolyl isomerase
MNPVFRRSRRVLPFLLAATLGLGLASCGDDEGGSSTANSDVFDKVSVTGEVGESVKVKFDSQVSVDDATSKVLTEGDGPEVADGDQVTTHIYLGNGFTKEQALNTYDSGSPEQLTLDKQQLSEVFLEALSGHTIGSRVAVLAPASEAFGETGNPALGIGNKDTILLVADLIKIYEPPEATDVPASKMPELVLEKGDPVGFDFSGLPKPKPDDELKRTVLEKGDGETVTPDMTLTVDYLGQVYEGKKPFDESFSKEPAEFALNQVVQGWTIGLSGVKVGSRVLLAIPPDLGYGEQAQPNIPANSTLYFVVDIRSAS